MIAKGTTHNSGGRLAVYLIAGKAGERAELWQLRGFASDGIKDAFRDVHTMAAGTRCVQPFFHVQVRNPEGEHLTREQWERVANRIESKIGYSGQPRAIAFHCNDDTGDRHMHIAWSRIDDETMTAKPVPFFKVRLKGVCRELENELGLTPVKNHRDTEVLAPSRDEFEQARRLGVNLQAVRDKIRECWDHADCGRSFKSALNDERLALLKGDRRDFLVMDQAGGIHALGQRILGCTAAVTRARLADLDRDQLPTLDQARDQLRQASREATHAGDLAWEDALAAAAIAKEKIERRFVEPEIPARPELNSEATLEAMTRRRATFTSRDVAWELREEAGNWQERAILAKEVLQQPSVVRLGADSHGVERYTTREVLETERDVLSAAHGLACRTRHEVVEHSRDAVLAREKFQTITAEQGAAVRHATGGEGLALIDGQAATGKSYTMGAIREIYEKQGHPVIGLAPTNAVAQDMKEDGFSRARTVHSELFALDSGRASWNNRTVVMVDEAAMIDTRNMAKLTAHAHTAGAKLILVGDDRQLSSIERGGMFGVLKERYGAAELTEVRRQQNEDDRRASALMAKGNFRDALASYDAKGAIHWAGTQAGARAALVDQLAKDSAAEPSKSRFVFAYTNKDANELNASIREVRRQRGELGESKSFETKHGPAEFATGDRLQFTGTDKHRGIYNGQAGTVQAIDGNILTVALDGRSHRSVRFNAAEFDEFRHGYAGTIYRGQGRTIDQTYLYHSEHWRSSASYVALTRHREKAELFAARETAADVGELAQQIARVDERRAASHFIQLDRAAGQGREQTAGVREALPEQIISDVGNQPVKDAMAKAGKEITLRGIAERETAASRTAKPAREPDESATEIRVAYQAASNAAELASALDRHGIRLAVVTASEAEHSTYKTGEIVAVTLSGQVHQLNLQTTGGAYGKVERFLTSLDRARLWGIEETQQQIHLETRRFIALTQRGALPDREPVTQAPIAEQPVDRERMLTDRAYRREIDQRNRERRAAERGQEQLQQRSRERDR